MKPSGSPARRKSLGRIFQSGLVLIFASCWWAASPPDTDPRPYPVSEVHQPPKLLYCSRYRPPAQNEPYVNAVQVEFDVSATGSVMNGRIVEEGAVVSSSGNLGEVMAMARSCVFTPAHHWGHPVAVRMSMWFVW